MRRGAALLMAACATALAPSAHAARFVHENGAPIDSAHEGVSVTRDPPGPAGGDRAPAHLDWLHVEPDADSTWSEAVVVARSEAGREMDRVTLRRIASGALPFEPLRLVADRSDRLEVAGAYRSLVVDFGGSVELLAPSGAVVSRVRVVGPFGLEGALRLRLRAVLVRYDDSGQSAAGGNDTEAARRTVRDLHVALSAWAQCGIGVDPNLSVSLVPRPPAHLLVVGAGYGFAASGGTVSLRIGKKPISVPIAAEQTALGAALQIAQAGRKLGFRVDIAQNERAQSQAYASVDLSFRTRAGQPIALHADGPISTDATLDVRIGEVDLRDGLDHFREEDSQTGTIEERTLLRAITDGDPTRIGLVMVPAFSGSGARLGESFIPSDGSSLAPMVIVDQRGVTMGAASMVAPHELGHVLLDQPGHPDAFGADTPSRLMDSDASDASAYGPRRLTLDECKQARQRALARGLLERWPLRR